MKNTDQIVHRHARSKMQISMRKHQYRIYHEKKIRLNPKATDHALATRHRTAGNIKRAAIENKKGALAPFLFDSEILAGIILHPEQRNAF